MALTVTDGIVNLAVEDLQRSLGFYAERLGFQVVERTGDDWTLLRAGDFEIALVPAGQPVSPQATSLLFVVDNINRALRELTRAGVEISDYFPEQRLVQFRDPDGHLLAAIQMAEEPAGGE
jgi:catechol 2,3-dioxygenase-like lactoylglutathione lyase family enzyme